MDLEILKIAANTDNNRNIENRTHVSKLKNSVCGDEMQIELILKNEKKLITRKKIPKYFRLKILIN